MADATSPADLLSLLNALRAAKPVPLPPAPGVGGMAGALPPNVLRYMQTAPSVGDGEGQVDYSKTGTGNNTADRMPIITGGPQMENMPSFPGQWNSPNWDYKLNSLLPISSRAPAQPGASRSPIQQVGAYQAAPAIGDQIYRGQGIPSGVGSTEAGGMNRLPQDQRVPFEQWSSEPVLTLLNALRASPSQASLLSRIGGSPAAAQPAAIVRPPGVPPATAQPSNTADALQQQMVQQYPWTKAVNANVVDSTGTGDPSGAGNKMEFYLPTDPKNPQLGRPTVVIYDKSMTPTDVMGELYSHYLPRVNPVVEGYRQQIIKSMTPDQVEGIRGDYERDKSVNNVNNLEFGKWLSTIGGDSFFRGYPTGQWAPTDYTPEQQKIFGQLNNYLSGSKDNVASKPGEP